MYNKQPWCNNISRKEQSRSILLTTIILLALLPLTTTFEQFWRFFFCLPPARICSLFLAVDCINTTEGYMLANEILPIHVTKACSAANFFILSIALISGTVIKSVRIKEFKKGLWILPFAYLVTISANTSRIIAGWITGRWARMLLPENFWPGIHLATGIVVFLTFLIATYLLVTWRHYDRS
jgi:exosortase K